VLRSRIDGETSGEIMGTPNACAEFKARICKRQNRRRVPDLSLNGAKLGFPRRQYEFDAQTAGRRGATDLETARLHKMERLSQFMHTWEDRRKE
jgi:hypothetical protein